MRSTAENLAPAAKARDVTPSTQLPDTLPAVRADAGRVTQALRNLLVNALRHTSPGGSISAGLFHRQCIGDCGSRQCKLSDGGMLTDGDESLEFQLMIRRGSGINEGVGVGDHKMQYFNAMDTLNVRASGRIHDHRYMLPVTARKSRNGPLLQP